MILSSCALEAGLEVEYARDSIGFQWAGCEEGDEVEGEGTAELLDDGTIEIEFAYHDGDEAVLKAKRDNLQQPVRAIDTPTLVVDGDHDVAIKREHTEYIAATIPNAGLLILPNVSHFAFLQDPKLFTFAILHFLGDE